MFSNIVSVNGKTKQYRTKLVTNVSPAVSVFLQLDRRAYNYIFYVEMLDRHEGIYKIRQEFINIFSPDYLQGYDDQNKCLLSMLLVGFSIQR